MKKIFYLLVLLNLFFTSCNEVDSELNRIKENRCSWCNSYGAKPVVYYENGERKESKDKFCSQKSLMEYSESHNK